MSREPIIELRAGLQARGTLFPSKSAWPSRPFPTSTWAAYAGDDAPRPPALQPFNKLLYDRLASQIAQQREAVSILDIARLCAARFGIPFKDIMSRSQFPEHARPRLAAYLIARRAGRSASSIARCFSRDHTTVCTGSRRIEAASKSNPVLRADIAAIEAKIAGGSK
jgi:Bacterial dnaA protein helix-turn-helix